MYAWDIRETVSSRDGIGRIRVRYVLAWLEYPPESMYSHRRSKVGDLGSVPVGCWWEAARGVE